MAQKNNKRKVIQDLPQTLVFNKRYTQMFPNNQKVTLYYCDALKKYFSISYDNSGYAINESDMTFIDNIKQISDIQTIYFKDESCLNVDYNCVSPIIDLFENIQEQDKQEFVEYLEASDKHFLRLLDYSINKFTRET